MRKEYDFSSGVRGSVSGGGQIIRPRRVKAGRTISDDDAPLSETQIRDLRRRLADLKDPVRYLIVARMGPRFALYYNVADDVYAVNDPKLGTDGYSQLGNRYLCEECSEIEMEKRIGRIRKSSRR